MLYIKRKSAVKPITGSIVDTTNINDKTKNTYSANVIDNKIAITKLTDISEILTIATGFTFLDGNIYKDRNKYFGNITIKKNSGNFNNVALETVATVNKTIPDYNISCILSKDQYGSEYITQCFISNDGIKVADWNNDATGKYAYAKINIDLVTQTTD